MPNRIPTQGIKTPAVRKSPGATAPAKQKPVPSPSPSTFDQKAAWTEKEFLRLRKMGLPIDKAREQAAKKYKINPNGYTN